MSNAGARGEQREGRRFERTLAFVQKGVAAFLEATNSADRYAVVLRLYHGWHRGLTPTHARRAAADCLQIGVATTCIRTVHFDISNPFGDRLLGARPVRLGRNDIHLPDTLRRDRADSDREREKMVDVALAADLLYVTRSDPDAWKLVLAEDDDVIPALFLAEYWERTANSKVFLLRCRSFENKHLNLNGLLKKLAG